MVGRGPTEGAQGAPPRPPGEGPRCPLAGPGGRRRKTGETGRGCWVSPVRSDPGSRQGELGVSGELGRRMPASTVPGGQEARRREAARPGESGLSSEYARKPGLLERRAWRRAHPGLRRAQSPPRGEVRTSRLEAGFPAFSCVCVGGGSFSGRGCCETRLEGTATAGWGEVGSP